MLTDHWIKLVSNRITGHLGIRFIFECMLHNFSKLYILNGNKSNLIVIKDENGFLYFVLEAGILYIRLLCFAYLNRLNLFNNYISVVNYLHFTVEG